MHPLIDIVRRARRSFRGSLMLRFVAVVSVATLTGASAGVLPAVIGRAVTAVTGAAAKGGPPPGTFAQMAARFMPAESTWAVVAMTLLATVVTVGIGVFASRMGTALAGDVTAAMRVEMMRAVLGASTRDVEEAGNLITGPAKPPGLAPPGKAPAGRGGATLEAVVRLAVSREAAMVSEFAVSVSTALPQSLATLAVLGVELVGSGAWVVLAGGFGLFMLSRTLADRASKRVGEARRELQNADAAVFGQLGETLSASEDLRLWGARDQALREFAEVARECAASRARFATALAIAGQIRAVFTAMAPLLIIVALKISGQSYGAGDVAKLLLLVPLLMIRLEALDGIRQGFIERGPLVEATQGLLDLTPSPLRAEDAVAVDPDELEGHIRFEGVSFTPKGADSPLIEDLTLDIPAGSVVGICGPSGSGKSTLLRLLLRLDDPDSGTITVDGERLERIDPDALPKLFGVVRQTSQLLQRPVRDNLSMGLDPAPSDAAMREALATVKMNELAGLGEPAREGAVARDLDTTYRRNPPNFSGGECRRLLIARMLLSNAPVHVLDEPEAGLPSGTAEQILDTIRELARGKTHVVVTHAPHLLDSDFNVVLDGGRIVDVGPHRELVARSESYRELLAEELRGE